MQPSSLRDVTGATSSLIPQNSNNAPGSTHSRSPPGRPEHPPHLSTHSDSNNLWYDIKRAQQSTSSSSTMIGPTSTFYNPDEHSIQRGDNQYQQWLDSYSNQQQAQGQQLEFSSVYRRDTNPGNGLVSQRSSQSPYSFMQGQYTSSSSMNQYPGSSVGTVVQSSVATLSPVIDASSYQTQTGDLYSTYYTDFPSVDGSSSGSTPGHGHGYHISTPESTLHSYTNSPDPVFEQQRQQQQTAFSQTHRQEPQNPSGAVQSSQFLQPSSTGYLPLPEHGSQPTHSNSPPAQPSPLNTWMTEQVFSNSTSNASGYQPQQQQYKAPAGRSKTRSSHPNKVTTTPLNRSTSSGGPSAQVSPRASGSASASAQAGVKRKRAKRNDSPEHPSQGRAQAEGASDSESDSDDDDSGLAMTGAIGVGLGGLGVVRKGGKRDGRSRL
ncbi:hypothetical protein CPB84DRAFT_1744830 [Gymnopilus junonius]|uniref:Uncharacterized protein n=1 Tax=Gymnopilus junonius TaxID=109634 RepID=A0A9P5NVX8_GYMJU|nr:hypothetical protein CPB84DRAFT_1744830 [Gymnopilus junonius]